MAVTEFGAIARPAAQLIRPDVQRRPILTRPIARSPTRQSVSASPSLAPTPTAAGTVTEPSGRSSITVVSPAPGDSAASARSSATSGLTAYGVALIAGSLTLLTPLSAGPADDEGWRELPGRLEATPTRTVPSTTRLIPAKISPSSTGRSDNSQSVEYAEYQLQRQSSGNSNPACLAIYLQLAIQPKAALC
jgi:hypothetical protein